MAPCSLCEGSTPAKAILRRPKTSQPVCRECFFWVFETEVHNTICGKGIAEAGKPLFKRDERVAIAASGGKDSTVLAHVMTLLNERHNYGLDLCLLSIDEGIRGYRDASLDTVKRNSEQYKLPLKVLSYDQLYGGWTMDKVVGEIGKRGNCTYCGVFRRQALDRGAHFLDVDHVVTGHNADDMAETIIMNVLRGDIARLERCTSITTGGDLSKNKPPDESDNNDIEEEEVEQSGCGRGRDAADNLGLPEAIKRSKPLKYAYEKEIVMYAYFKKLDYHSTECIYSPTAYRGHARALVKDLERERPTSIIDIIYSGEAMAEAAALQVQHVQSQNLSTSGRATPMSTSGSTVNGEGTRTTQQGNRAASEAKASKRPVQQACQRCGSMSSAALCQACVLLEGLNRGVAKISLDERDRQRDRNALGLGAKPK